MRAYTYLELFNSGSYSYCLNPHYNEGDIMIDERFSIKDNIERFLGFYEYVTQKKSLLNLFAIKYFKEKQCSSGSFNELTLIK